MKTDTLKKSLLDYAIKGKLTAKFRRENSELSAFDELEIYNDKIKQKRKNLEKKLKICEKELKLEKDKDKKALFKSQIQILKKEIAKCKEITPLNLSEAPFEIPNTWAWVKLGDICEIISGEIIDLQEENLPLLDVKYLRSKGDKKLANSGNFANANDRLILMDGENSGEIFITKEKGFLGSTLKKLEFSSLSQVEFMDFMLLCYKDFFKGNKKGAAIPHLDRKLFTNLSIPLPPLKEQQEIVKKLDLLVTLANDFAITKENLKRIEKRIEKSLLKLALEGSLSKLYRRSSPTLCAFDEINTYNEAIKEKRKDLEKELKKCEKELKLEKDKDKKAFFKSQIQMLKKELTKCKEITPLNLSEAPFTIPNSWAWVKLGDICEMKKGPFGSAITKDMFIPNGNNAVKIYEQKNAIQKSETLGEYYISLEHFEKLKQFEVFENDIIVSCAGTIGEIFRIPKNAPKGIINQALMKIKLVNEEWIPYFMIFFDFLIKQKSQENSKGSAIKNIPPLDILKNFSIPLPPLCEQEHIVQTLDTLFTLKKGLRVD
ncbi:restriction endonuclease subunit S [Campylobacter upsaliensis]|uniref:restriction endonuclease subunit S n=1 Tax=Campylobacter upsaliensis TaxID=28080 RepID=UPI001D3F5858|nr:restriction endonuclease subunit S [Campylobacter upsaliensis]EIE1465196.1 restriction endonuclease subunit S [Campylobacter upsaliensis]MCR2106494.1 restriction endonuclease subunit S [Campylobacter upsaliensis]